MSAGIRARAPAWGADLITEPGLEGAWRIIRATISARALSQTVARASLTGNVLGVLLAAVGGSRYGQRKATTPGKSASALAMAGIDPAPRRSGPTWRQFLTMPIMTAGLAQLRGRQADAGNVFNNVTLRVAASLGVAVVGGLVTVQHAQLMADRGAFVVAGATAPQALTRAAAQGAEGLAPLDQELTKAVVAVTYANAFYTVGWLTAIGVLLATFLPGHSQPRPQPNNSATATRDTPPARPAGHSTTPSHHRHGTTLCRSERHRGSSDRCAEGR